MSVNHVIRRGDSLYALAGRYLGNTNHWPEIFAFHNEQVKLHGPGNKALFAIKDPNRIYVGQVLVIPGRGQHPKVKPALTAGAGKPTQAAIPVELKTVYYIGPPKNPARASMPTTAPDPPKGKSSGGAFAVPLDLKSENTVFQTIRYKPLVTPGFTMTSEMSGEITLENMSPDRHRSNWELAITDDRNALSHKLRQAHDKAFLELTGEMGMAFDPKTRRVILRPSIAAKAGLGPYEVEAKADGPNHFSYGLKLEALSGQLEHQGRIFRFAANVAIRIDITLHPTPMQRLVGGGTTKKPATVPQGAPADMTSQLTTFEMIGSIIVAVLLVFGGRALIMQKGGAMSPAMHNPAFGPYHSHKIDSTPGTI